MPEPRPSVRRRRLAALLVRLREGAGKTPEEAAERIGCHRSKISRIENARLGLSLGELRDLLTFYGVDDQHYVEEVVDLARRGTERGWVQRLGVALPSYADYIDYEQTADYIRSYQPMLIAGLLQTADYARELFRASPVRMPPHRVDELVTVRMQRQKVLSGESVPHVCVIEGEAALRGQVGGRKVMRAQLEHLQLMAESVELQVLPLSAGAHAGVMGSFVLFSFPTPAFSDVVCVEHRTGTLYMETPEETDVYRLTFDALRSAALSPSASLDLISDISQEL
ncbi:helix-turn-helix transcriptional regulator [Streptomyces mobaraensis]|uniref:helix-turn-helix domain-containing protein n=1 Tax=Streptomyces mobaraensis TaxID=35621 RepID=UPI00332E7B0E